MSEWQGERGWRGGGIGRQGWGWRWRWRGVGWIGGIGRQGLGGEVGERWGVQVVVFTFATAIKH